MYQSDSNSSDSDEGIRFKTQSIRNKSPTSDADNVDSNDTFGPSIPPNLLKKTETSNKNDMSSAIGPALPPHLTKKDKHQPHDNEEEHYQSKVGNNSQVIGPALPPHLLNKQEITNSSEKSTCSEIKSGTKKIEHDSLVASIGPALPPHLLTKSSEENDGDSVPVEETNISIIKRPVIGPALPPHLQSKCIEDDSDLVTAKQRGHQSEEEEEEEEVYGPLPPGMSVKCRAQVALEERALQMKLDQLEPNTDGEPVREEWMLELPQNRASNLGLGPRQFRSKTGPDLSDRSSWTDTPEDKKRKSKGLVEEKVDLKGIAEQRAIEKKNKQQEEIVKKHKRKNKESLLEIHQKKLKEKKDEQGPSERRPFSRELDLQVNRFDEAQKKAVLKKAQLLDDRFARGQSKFI